MEMGGVLSAWCFVLGAGGSVLGVPGAKWVLIGGWCFVLVLLAFVLLAALAVSALWDQITSAHERIDALVARGKERR